MDDAFKQVIKLFGVRAVKLMRRREGASPILDGMNVALLTLGQKPGIIIKSKTVFLIIAIY